MDINDKVNKLTLLSVVGVNKNKSRVGLFECDCEDKTQKEIPISLVANNHTKSCGCVGREKNIARLTTHNKSRTKEYRTWTGIIDRCYNPKSTRYKHYGERGIEVCDRWLGENGFINFYEDMGNRPFDKASIDRIDVNGNYSKDNCRWVSLLQQARNRQNTFYVDYNGERISICDLAEMFNINSKVLKHRLKLGWDINTALTQKVRKSKKRKEK